MVRRGRLWRITVGLLGFTDVVVSGESLQRLVSTVAAFATDRRVQVASRFLLFAGLVFVLLRLRALWRDSHVDLGHVGWTAAVGALVAAVSATAASGFIWLEILRRLGATPLARWVCVFFEASLAKYIPGSLWQYAGRTGLARAQGISVGVAAASLPVEFVGSTLAAALFTLLLLGWWGMLVIALATLAGLGAIRFSPVGARLEGGGRGRVVVRSALRATPLYVAAWSLTGLSFWLVARALLGSPLRDFPLYVGAFAAAWLAGVFAVFAPGGLGVREAVLVAILRGKIGAPDALVLATASRVVLALVDVGLAGAGFSILRRHDASRT